MQTENDFGSKSVVPMRGDRFTIHFFALLMDEWMIDSCKLFDGQ